MDAKIYKGNRVYDIAIPSEWSHFWLFIELGFCCLVISALLAKVKIGSFPVNPIYWHFWVIANAEAPPLVSDNLPPRIYRPYMFFWAGSVCFFILAFLVLVVMFSAN